MKTNYERLGGHLQNNSYQKIPRDALRVGILHVCSLINKDLCTEGVDPEAIIEKLLMIYSGLRLLDKLDAHRAQVRVQLQYTLKYGRYTL